MRLFVGGLTAVLSLSVAHAAPVQLAHQLRVVDATGAPVNGAHQVSVELFAAATGGSAVFSESFAVQLDGGYAAVLLGSGVALDSADLAGARWVQTSVDGVAMGNRQPLAAVPSAATVGGLSAEDLVAQTELLLTGSDLSTGAQLDGFRLDGDALVLGGGGWGKGTADLLVPSGVTLELEPGVHEYDNIVIDGIVRARAFNGVDGGTVLLRARGTATINGLVDASGRGYRGGLAEYAMLTNQNQGTPGQPGESHLGWWREGWAISSSNVAGGGGGGLYDHGNYGCAGAGGGYGGTGTGRSCPGNSGLQATGGQSYGDAELSTLYLGSGGGASGSDEDHRGRGGHGGAGGGAIRIEAQHLIVAGEVLSMGAAGSGATVSNNGGGGGGSGGSIHLRAGQLDISGTVRATGGSGGAQNGGGGVGGPGGVGRIRLDGTVLNAGGSISPAAGHVDQDAAYALGGGDYGVYTSPVLSFEEGSRWSSVDVFAATGPTAGLTVSFCAAEDAAGTLDDACFRAVSPSGAVLAAEGLRFGRVRIIGWDDASDLRVDALRATVAR